MCIRDRQSTWGTDLVKNIVAVIPEWLTNGLTLVSKILPAYGFALLLSIMLSGKMLPFLLVGFFITAYSGLSVTGIAIFACITAFVLAEFKFSNKKAVVDALDDLQKEGFQWIIQRKYQMQEKRIRINGNIEVSFGVHGRFNHLGIMKDR
eukprot:TRINITY_DN47763_c0_g1_i1.p3 TRINITY_DN47763_c0_g1~~TRINITY_DN47763_c0_g1_i1.p3  ORF type:complete len:174 (-),score=18.70 TRINITY_DN47763_c0_g1_i1:467-916(-)